MKENSFPSLLLIASLAFVGLAACEKAATPPEQSFPEDSKAVEADPAPAIRPKLDEVAKPTSVPPASNSSALVDPGDANSQAVTKAVAVLHPTKGSKTKGTIKFQKAGNALQVTAEVTGLSPGKHAFHVHLLGDCSSNDGKSAGTHFNLKGSSKKPPSDIDHITGDLGDLDANKKGVAKKQVVLKDASFSGPFSVLGRSVIVHEKANDHKSPPIGAAGGRLACGVIGITE